MLDVLAGDDEPLIVGIIASPDEASQLGSLLPEVVWHRYKSLEQFWWWGELDEVDVLIVDVCYLRGDGPNRVAPGPGALGCERVKSVGDQIPLVLLLAPESRISEGPLPEGALVLRKPVATRGVLQDVFAAHAERIWARRLRRLFREVAAAFAGNIRH